MPGADASVERLRRTLYAAWSALQDSYAGLPDSRLIEPGVVDTWSVKDVLAHITTWEEEALKYLPLIAEGGRPPRYAAEGGIDAFNARMTEQKRGMSLAEVRARLEETHRRLLDLVERAPADHLIGQTRFRRRLRWDTYHHYLEHAQAILKWRERMATK